MTRNAEETTRSGDSDFAEPAEEDIKGPGPVPTPDEPVESDPEKVAASTLDKLWAAAENDKALFLSGLQARALANVMVGLLSRNTEMAAMLGMIGQQPEPKPLWTPPAPGQGRPL